jgi:hypothetical protein
MSSLVLNGEPISVSILWVMAKCRLFHTKLEVLSKPNRVESGVSSDSLQLFGGAVAEISYANVRDLSQHCHEFNFIELEKTVRGWQPEHPLIDPEIRDELDLVGAALTNDLNRRLVPC